MNKPFSNIPLFIFLKLHNIFMLALHILFNQIPKNMNIEFYIKKFMIPLSYIRIHI